MNTSDAVRLSHRDRRNRREQMANDIKAGKYIGDVAREHGVSMESVKRACVEFGVPIPSTVDAAHSPPSAA